MISPVWVSPGGGKLLEISEQQHDYHAATLYRMEHLNTQSAESVFEEYCSMMLQAAHSQQWGLLQLK